MPTNLNFINVCWGAEYSKMCVEEMLPTFLSPGNFAHPSLTGRAKFVFYTTPADYEQMKTSPAVQRLEQLMDVVVFDLSQLQAQLGPGGSKYSLMGACHRHATLMGSEERSAVVFLWPDAIASDGVCRRLVELVDLDKSAVLMAGPRISRNDFRREITKLHGDDASRYPGIAPRELIRIALQTMTRTTQSLFWDSPDVTIHPSNLAWRVDASGYFIRGFHLHPLMIRPEIQGDLPLGTIDGHYLTQTCPHADRYHFVTDSDEFSIFSLTSYDEFPEHHLPGRYSEEALAAYIAGSTGNMGKQHFLFSRKILRFHTQDLTEKWAAIEAESNLILGRIFQHVGAIQSRRLAPEQWTKIFQDLLTAQGQKAAPPLS